MKHFLFLLFTLIPLVILNGTGNVRCARIMLGMMDHAAHVNFFSVVGGTLSKAGHDVYVLVPLQHEKVAKKHGIKTIPVDYTVKINTIQEEVGNKGNTNMMSLSRIVSTASFNQTKELFANQKVMKQIKDLKFDLMMLDGTIVYRHNYALPYKLSVPYITMMPIPDPWTLRIPSLPSIEGQTPFVLLNEDSTIFDRIHNVLVYVLIAVLNIPSPYTLIDGSMLSKLAPEKPDIGFDELYRRSEMIIINFDVICMDFPRVSSPYYKFIGGLGVETPQPLQSDLQKIMTSASKHGAIVLSFGSGMKTMPDEILFKMLEAFRTLKQTVIMRYVKKNKNNIKLLKVPSNVHMMSWLPQNDLLGHPNTKLFITHTGGNGQLETIYHGVPILAMPLFGDQLYNAKRAVLKGYGLQLDPNTFTVKEMKDTINELLENKTYSDTIKKCSAILHDLPNPQTRVLFWVEHVLKFGSQHLKPFYLNMPLWKFLMLDVQLVFLVVLVLEVLLVRWCICKYCYRKKKVSKKRVKKD